MKLFVLNDAVVKDIINRLTIDDKTREIVETIILRFDYSYTNFIYSMFSVYTTYYAQLTDSNCHISYRDAQDIYKNLLKTNLEIDRSNVFVADVYDILYVASAYDKTRFKCHFYEDTYSRVENLYGTQISMDDMSEIFDALETIFGIIEENLISNLIERASADANVIFYLELTVHGLMIYVI